MLAGFATLVKWADKRTFESNHQGSPLPWFGSDPDPHATRDVIKDVGESATG
jgi:hypothetical protein